MRTRIERGLRRSGSLAVCFGTVGALAIGMGVPAAARAATTPYMPGTVIVGYKDGSTSAARIASASGGTAAPVSVLHLPAGTNLQHALERLRSDRDVSFAVPDYIARASTVSAGTSAPTTIVPPAPFIPENVGSTNTPGGWQALQWNFVGAESVEAPQAWGNLIADHAEGGRGVVVAVLDTGVAYRNWRAVPSLTGIRSLAVRPRQGFREPWPATRRPQRSWHLRRG